VSRTSLVVSTHDGAEFGEQRVSTLRLFNGHFHRVGGLALLEAAIVVLALHAAVQLRFAGFSAPVKAFELSAGPIWPKALVLAAVFVVSLTALGLYELRQRMGLRGVLARLTIAVGVALLALASISYVAPSLYVGRGVLVLTAAFTFTGLALARYVFLRVVDEEFFKRRVLVWGTGERAGAIVKRLRRRTDQRGFRIIGYVPGPADRACAVPQERFIRSSGTLVGLALRHRVEEIVVAMDDRRGGFPTAELLECRLRGIEVSDIVTFLERQSGRVTVELMHPSWLIFSKGFRCDLYRLAIKRLFDVAVSLAVLVFTLPISLLTALAIYLEDRGPIFYRQVRVGQNGRHFTLLKFRSMRVNAEAHGTPVWAQAGDPRVTRVGGLIRRLRIDEIPQAINVLLGDMSFVGPRPERPEFVKTLARTIPFYSQRHFVKPGVTGWAQVRYGYGASAKDATAKLEYDLYYVKHHSLAFDLMVLLQTVEIVVFRIGSR
jgi:sugar transferase (PEP-CTERM system associated)